jgi:thiol:disulfide interchange protein DsbD
MKRFWHVFLFLGFIGFVNAQDDVFLRKKAEVRPAFIQQGNKGDILLFFEVDPQFHLSDASSGLFKVIPKPVDGITFGKISYPKGDKEPSIGFVYRGDIESKVPFHIDNDLQPGDYTISLSIDYQPCAEIGGICYPPGRETMDVVLSIVQGQSKNQSESIPPVGIEGRLASALEKGSLIAFLVVFVGGLLTSFTPCVYPMIPITLAVIGAQASGSKLKGFVLSLFYVLGIAITFSTLGVIAAKTGSLFGSFAQHPITIVLISTIFLLMGLSMLGVFVMQMPSSIASKLQKKRTGFLGALFTGLVAGLIVSPCISPLLIVILTWVAKSGSVLMGIGLLFFFALGLGVLFILIGTFSGILKNLPKSGGWMELIERGFGILLVVLAVVFLRPLLSPLIYQFVWAVLLIILGTFIGAFSPVTLDSDVKQKLGKAIGFLTVLIGASLLFFGVGKTMGFHFQKNESQESTVSETISWFSSDVLGFQEAMTTGKPVLVDFFAEWCPACHELDKKTWPDPEVQSLFKKVIPVKLDQTRNDEQTKSRMEKYGVLGMPTVILFDPSGKELDRFEGFHPPDAVISFLKKYVTP